MYPTDNPFPQTIAQDDPTSNDQLLKLLLMSNASKGGSQGGASENRIQALLSAMANQNPPTQMGQSSGMPTGQARAGSSGVAQSGVNNMMTALNVASKIYGGK